MQKGNVSALGLPSLRHLLRLPLPRSYTDFLGRKLFRFLLTIQGLGAFALITLGVMLRRFGASRRITKSDGKPLSKRLDSAGCGWMVPRIAYMPGCKSCAQNWNVRAVRSSFCIAPQESGRSMLGETPEMFCRSCAP